MEAVYVSNESYARHLGVSMYSLFDNNMRCEKIRVTVLSTGIGEESQRNLRFIADAFGREIVFYDLSDLKDRLGFQIDTGKFDISTMGRLLIGEVLPEETERVLYLDCDTVVLRPLDKMYRTDLGENILGAVPEPTIYPEVKKYLGLADGETYFNAGVLLIDLKKWRAENVRDRVLSYYRTIADKSLFNDQDALNGALKGRILSLSPVYNFFTNYRYFRYEYLAHTAPFYRRVAKSDFELAKHHPAVLHFAGDERPWKAGSLNHYRAAYEKYLGLTPWRGTAGEPGSAGKLFLYHMMEWITFFFPEIRKKISGRYVQKLMRERENRAEH
jgi:lipopolysaccharide biosynthesis glycosyltransferase